MNQNESSGSRNNGLAPGIQPPIAPNRVNFNEVELFTIDPKSVTTNPTGLDLRLDTGFGDIDDDVPRSRSFMSLASLILDTTGGTYEEEDEVLATEIIKGGAPVPPDGGYGWVIVFCSFVANLVIDGITCTFGIFLPQMVISFEAGNGQVAWAGSLLAGGALLLGPIVGALTNKFGCRIVCMSGGIIGAAGFVISSFANSLAVMLVSYGILGAIGLGLIYLPNIVSVGYYFEKRRALATGIAMCGSGFGAIAFPPLASWLIGKTTWRNVNFMYAGLLFFAGCCGALIRPLEVKREEVDDFGEEGQDGDPNRQPLLCRMDEDEKHHVETWPGGSDYFIVQLPDGGLERRHKVPLTSNTFVQVDQFPFSVAHSPVLPQTLETITEMDKQGIASDSEGSRAATPDPDPPMAEKGQGNLPDEEEEGKRQGIPIPNNSAATRRPYAEDGRRGQEVSPLNHRPGFRRQASLNEGAPIADSVSLHHLRAYGSQDANLGKVERKYNIRAVPARPATDSIRSALYPILFSRSPRPRRDSVTSGTGSRRTATGSISESTNEEGVQFVTDLNWPSSTHCIIRPLSRKDIFYSGSIKHLPDEYQDPFHYRVRVLNLPSPDKDADVVGPTHRGGRKPTSCTILRTKAGAFWTALKNFMDFSLLRNPIFLCIALSGVIGMLGFHVPFVYIIDYAGEKNISRDNAAILISIIGIMNTIGRIGFGLISDSPRVNSLYVNNFCLLGMGMSVGSVPFCHTYVTLIIVYVLFGLFLSGFISLTSITLVDLLGLDNLTNSFGLLMFFRGFASIIGSPFAGFLYDTFGSYDIPFFIAGTFLVLASLISSMIPFVVKCCPNAATVGKDGPGVKKTPAPETLTDHLPDIPERRESEDRDSGRFSDVDLGKSDGGSDGQNSPTTQDPLSPRGVPNGHALITAATQPTVLPKAQ